MLVIIAILLGLILLAVLNRQAAAETIYFGIGCFILLVMLGLSLFAGAIVMSMSISAGKSEASAWLGAIAIGLGVFFVCGKVLSFFFDLLYSDRAAQRQERNALKARLRAESHEGQGGWRSPSNE